MSLASPLFSRIPLDKKPVQHQWQDSHKAQVKPVIQLRGLIAAFTYLLEVGPLTSGTDLPGQGKKCPG